MEEVFEFIDDKNSFTVKISDVQINNVTAFVAEFQQQGSSVYDTFKDHNGMTYYFTDKEFLKRKVIQVLSDITSLPDTI